MVCDKDRRARAHTQTRIPTHVSPVKGEAIHGVLHLLHHAHADTDANAQKLASPILCRVTSSMVC